MCKTCYGILGLSGKMNIGAQLNYELCERYELKEEPYNEDHKHCICGHFIKNLFYIRHKINGTIYIIGSDCIEMLFPENDELIKLVTYNLCRECDKNVKNLKSHYKSAKHKKNAKYACCVICHEQTVRKKSNNKKCNKCIIHKRENTCKQCKKWNINDTFDDICNVCVNLNKERYVMKMSKTHRQCEYCSEYKIKLTTDEKWQYCYDCNVKNISCPQDCGDYINFRQMEKYKRCYKCFKSNTRYK